MISLLLIGMASMVPGIAPASSLPDSRTDGLELAQIIVRSHVVIRVETAPATPALSLRSMFREKKGPRCVAMSDMVGAAVIEPNSVDLALRNGTRMRARFARSCPGLDYYSGFYIAPTADAKLCAERDVVRDRAGGECAVDKIKQLVPRK